MIATPLLSTATNIIVGSITTKIFDSIVTTKLVQKQEKNKWIRDKKLNLFSQLSENILTMNCDNLSKKKILINEISSQIILLIEDRELKKNLENYSFILNEYECYENDINIHHLNDELISTLSSYLKRL